MLWSIAAVQGLILMRLISDQIYSRKKSNIYLLNSDRRTAFDRTELASLRTEISPV